MSQERWDVIVIGAAAIGASIAYHIMAAAPPGLRLLMVERDPSYEFSASARSAGSIRQQFTTSVNVQMAAYNFRFLQEAPEALAIGEDKVHLQFTPGSYLFLADAAGADGLRKAHDVQRAAGAAVELLDPSSLQAEFPWLTVDDLTLGSIGRAGEGWFDGYALAQALRRKAVSMGARFLKADVERIVVERGRATGVSVDGAHITGDVVVCAAGVHSPSLLRETGLDLPVRARRRSIFHIKTPVVLGCNLLVIDPSGVYIRPEGEGYICGVSPREDPDVDATDFSVDHDLFDDVIWPTLAHRIAGMEQLKLTGAWSGHYDLNIVDHNCIIGGASQVAGLFFATGFSGHGLQQSPSIGRGLAELILTGKYQTIDLSALGEGRLGGTDDVERAIV